MPVITLPDGSQRSYAEPVTVEQIAADIGPGLAKAALAGKVDGRLVDTSYLIDKDAQLAIVTGRDTEGVDVIRHSTAHLLAQAVKQLFPRSPGQLLLRLRLQAALHDRGSGRDRGACMCEGPAGK